MEVNKETVLPLIIAALLGTTGGGGVSTYLQTSHMHPEIIREIRKVQYQSEIFKLSTQIDAMAAAGEDGSSAYTIANTQLSKFTEMLTELK